MKTSTPSSTDSLFAKPQTQVVDFSFTDAVADVFPDMIRRSVPGYDAIISLLGVIAQQSIQKNTRIYDLGSSLGASTLSIAQHVRDPSIEFICVDNSSAMTERCHKIFQRHIPDSHVSIHCDDISAVPIENASLVVINFTLQFLPKEQRLDLLKKAYAGLHKGGAIILSEKLIFNDDDKQQQLTEFHYGFKRANGYSELEISQKRSALDKVMIPDTLDEHLLRLKQAGFKQAHQWFQCFNFVSLVAIKA